MTRADGAFPDLRAAFRYSLGAGDLDTALRLVSSIGEYAMRSMRYEVLGWAHDGVLFAGGLDGGNSHPLFLQAKALYAYGAWLRGEFDTARQLADEVEHDEAARSDVGTGLAQRVQANVLYVQGEIEAGLAASRRRLQLAEESGDTQYIAHGTYMLSIACNSTGEIAEAAQLAEQCLRVGERSGSPTDLASGWAATGFAAHDDRAAALHAFAESDRIARNAGNRWMSAFARTELSGLLLLDDQLERACIGLAEVVDTWFRAGEWSQQWHTLSRCAIALVATGNLELAAQVIGAVEQRATMGTPPVIASLRERALGTATELTERLGAEHYAQLHAAGGALPVVEVVHRTRAGLLGRGASP